MKLIELSPICENMFNIDEISDSEISIHINESAGGFVKKSLQGITQTAKKHPYISAAMAMYAFSAYKNYKKNKRNTISLYSKDFHEKQLFSDIKATLLKTGKYRLEKDTNLEGGHLIVLKKV